MTIKIEDYNMSEEEKVSRIVQLEADNAVNKILISSLVSVLLTKGDFTHEELVSVQHEIIEDIRQKSADNGVNTEKLIEYIKESLNL
jgi:hypothetical protein